MGAWVAGVVSLGVTLAAVPIVRRLAFKWKLTDAPGPLKIHSEPIPRVGGVAVAGALAFGMLAGGAPVSERTWPFYVGLLIILLAGLTDDVRGLSPRFRLGVQAVAALVLCLPGERRFLVFGFTWVDLFISCLFVVVLVNSFNFLDGSDGLAAGVSGMIGLGYILVDGGTKGSLVGIVAWALLGGCLGFLVFNLPPARIFLGDSGSTSLGFIVAFLGLDFHSGNSTAGSTWLLPLVFAGVPLTDFALTIWRRLRRHEPLFCGDREHYYDLLLQRGWSPRHVALWTYAASGALTGAGVMLHRLR